MRPRKAKTSVVRGGVKKCLQICSCCLLPSCCCDVCGLCYFCEIEVDWDEPDGGYHGHGCHIRSHECTFRHESFETSPGAPMASENALKRFAQLFETDIFTCKIGTEKTYFVHKDALGSASGVLKKQMESCMKEGLTKCITLEDTADDGCAFGLFVQFCYLGEYYYEQRLNGALTVHASVYVLAEKIEALELKALALKKATSLCKTSQGITAVDRESAQALRLSLPETVPVIYNGTYDNNTGKLPTSPAPESMAGNTEAPSVVRDGFRMLIAKFAATCIHELRNIEEFMSVLEDFPAFASDILLFAYPAPNAIMDGTGSRKRPRDTGAY